MLGAGAAMVLAFAACTGGQQAAQSLTASGLNPAKFDTVINGDTVKLYTLKNQNGLEACIRKPRPDGDGMHSMPSTHTMIAFSGASYLQRRYGWKWGAPAYAVATYVAWGRVHSKRHDIWDVLAGTAIGVGFTYIFTRPFMKGADVVISPSVIDDAKCLSVAVTF